MLNQIQTDQKARLKKVHKQEDSQTQSDPSPKVASLQKDHQRNIGKKYREAYSELFGPPGGNSREIWWPKVSTTDELQFQQRKLEILMECHKAKVSCKILKTGDDTITDSSQYQWTQEDTKLTTDIIEEHYGSEGKYERLPAKLRKYLEDNSMGWFMFGSVRTTKRNPTKHSPYQGFGYICI